MVQVLLAQGASITARDKRGWLALHSAAHAGFLDIVHLLVENGAPTTAMSHEGHVPLWLAMKDPYSSFDKTFSNALISLGLPRQRATFMCHPTCLGNPTTRSNF